MFAMIFFIEIILSYGYYLNREYMDDTSSTLGSRERVFLTSMASQDRRIFRFQDAISYWTSVQQARKALSRLAKNGWIKRLKRGLYLLVPLEAGIDGQWSDDPLLIGTQLAPEAAIAYWTALHFWQMTEQVPRTIFVQAKAQRSPAQETILGVRYQFVSITPERFFGIQKQSSKGMTFGITDREKTLIDACSCPDLCGGILQIAQVLESVVIFDWGKLDQYLERFDSGAVYKRLGYLVERLNISMPDRETRLERWQSKLSQGIAWLEPGEAQSGSINTRWRVRVNIKSLENGNDL